MADPICLNGAADAAASSERVRQLEENLAAMHNRHLSDALHLSERIDRLSHENRELREHALREAAFLRGLLVAQAIVVSAYLAGVVDVLLRVAATAAVAWFAVVAAGKSRWIQRKIRDFQIWWDTRQIHRGKR